MNDHGLEQLVHFSTQKKKKMDLILNSLPGQFQDIHKLSDHDIVSGTLKVIIPTVKKPRRKVHLYQKGDFESMRTDAFEFAMEKIFQWSFGYSLGTRKLWPDYIFYSGFGG